MIYPDGIPDEPRYLSFGNPDSGDQKETQKKQRRKSLGFSGANLQFITGFPEVHHWFSKSPSHFSTKREGAQIYLLYTSLKGIFPYRATGKYGPGNPLPARGWQKTGFNKS